MRYFFTNITTVLIILLFGGIAFSQTPTQPPILNADVVDSTQLNNEPLFLQLRPWVGIGGGNLAYFGDIAPAKIDRVVVSPIAYQLSVAHTLNKFLTLRFSFLGGKMGLSGLQDKRYFNFKSQIYAGSVNLEYNFNHFLNPNRYVEPFVNIGISGFEFLSKADQFDADGNTYYYWSDGSIRNIDESSKDKYKAQIIKRDYVFESDLRTQNKDKIGNYPEYSFALPIGGGINFLLDDKFQFKLGTTYYLTATDQIDNISSKGVGIRQGKKGNDNFLFTYAAASYNLTRKKEIGIINYDQYVNDLVADGDEDADGDGVIDFIDSSAYTPEGVLVNRKGIPYDNDRDNIPNYLDKEVKSAPQALVSQSGVELADTTVERLYNEYLNPIDVSKAKIEKLKDVNATNAGNGTFKVLLGEFSTGVPSDKINKFLSIKEMNNYSLDDSTVAYTTGMFNTYAEAKGRLETVNSLGLTDAKVVVHKNGKFIPVNDNDYYRYEADLRNAVEVEYTGGVAVNINKNYQTTDVKPSLNKTASKSISKDDEIPTASTKSKFNIEDKVYHVQLGAYKHKVSKTIFANVPDLAEIKGDDGITRVMSGEFENFEEAAKRKVEMQTKGFEEAFVTV
ncbi:MAG: SPOR domain-containing protein, partial [Bacteroidia bacterium]|nr:SPOR domain-containing protein [Bacteroidia bacterium]